MPFLLQLLYHCPELLGLVLTCVSLRCNIKHYVPPPCHDAMPCRGVIAASRRYSTSSFRHYSTLRYNPPIRDWLRIPRNLREAEPVTICDPMFPNLHTVSYAYCTPWGVNFYPARRANSCKAIAPWPQKLHPNSYRSHHHVKNELP
jgi:hypothetical protein